MNQIKIAQFGLGPIGVESLKLVASKPWAKIVGAIDIDPNKVGKSLADITGIQRLDGCKIYPTFDQLWEQHQPQVILHTAGSKAKEAIDQMIPMVKLGVSVASTCEELLYPALRAPAEAKKIDGICRQHDARIVGTGVNPGFVMDVMPIFLTGVCRSVQRIFGESIVNASTRRMPLQKKIGSGVTPDEFRQMFKEGKLGHAGFQESVALIAHCMDWKLDEIVETCEPMVADHDIQTEFFEVHKGLACGLHQRCEGKMQGESKIELDLKMYLDAENPKDTVRLEGDPSLSMQILDGVEGDGATVAALVNAIPRLLYAPAGLRLMTELPVPSWTNDE